MSPKTGAKLAGGGLWQRRRLPHRALPRGCPPTVPRPTIEKNLKSVKWTPDPAVIWPANKPILPTGGVVGLKGNLAPEGAIVKVAGWGGVGVFRPAAGFYGGGGGSLRG